MADKSKPTGKQETVAVRSGTDSSWHQSLLTPIAQTSTYVFDKVADLQAFQRGELSHPEYSRYHNPTLTAVEKKLAELEGAEDALLTGSGMAAISIVLLAILARDKHVIITRDHYPGTRVLLDLLLPRFGIRYDTVPVDDFDAMAAAACRETSILFTEIPTNPHLQVPDLARMAQIADECRATFVVDSTLASPILCRPLEHGADVVIHSATKYLGGHNDLLAGVIAGKQQMIDVFRETNGAIGAVLGPHDAFLLDRGLKTLPLRMGAHSASGRTIAERLRDHDLVARCWYPGFPDSGGPDLAGKYLSGGGGLLSFVPAGGIDAAHRFLDNLELVSHAASLGGTETMAQVTYLYTMFDVPPETAREQGLEPDLVRLSVGLENVDDIWQDIEQALVAAHK